MRRRGHAPRDEGFTLIELLVTMSIATIVLIGILNSADLFASSASSSRKAAAAQDAARASVREMVAFLRQGRVATGQTTPIPAEWTPSRSDLVVAAYVAGAGDPSPGDVPGWIRYCAPAGTPSSLVVGVRVGDTYAAPGTCSAADTTNSWANAVRIKGTVAAPEQLFNFTSTACSGASCLPTGPNVATVGIRLSVRATASSSRQGAVVTDAVSFRNRSN